MKALLIEAIKLAVYTVIVLTGMFLVFAIYAEAVGHPKASCMTVLCGLFDNPNELRAFVERCISNCPAYLEDGKRSNTIYDNVSRIAKSKGYSISKLEKECDWKNSTISKWNNTKPGVFDLMKVAKILNVTLDELVEGVEHD